VPASWGGPTSASSTYTPEGADAEAAGSTVELEPVRGDYFRSLGMTLLAGRSFTPADRADAPPVAVINETLARRFWPGGDTVGRGMVKPGSGAEVTVVGVVADVKRTGLDQAAQPVAYLPHAQAVWSHSLFVTLRTATDPDGVGRALRAEVWSLDPAAAVTGIAVLSDLVSGSVAEPRLRVLVFGALAGTAGALALVGIYGVLAFAVARRTREMAVRLALGAGRRRVLEEVLARGVGLVALGLALGGAGALAATRFLRAFLFDVGPLDPLTFAAVPLAFLAAGALACWVPARRAAAADPAAALREG
jgi:predicted permease